MTGNPNIVITAKMDELFQLLKSHDKVPVSVDLFKNKSPKELISATTSYGESLLTIAAQVDATEIVEYLLSVGVYKNQLDTRGGTALMRAAVAKSYKTIDILISQLVDPRLVSSFSGKKAHEVIDHPPLTRYANRFEALLSNPFFNYKYRLVYEFRYALADLAKPGLVKGSPKHPLLDGVTNWLDKLDQIKTMEKEYEQYLKGDVPPIKGCLYCDQATDQKCKICKKVSICSSCLQANNPLLSVSKAIHTNNCKQGIFK